MHNATKSRYKWSVIALQFIQLRYIRSYVHKNFQTNLEIDFTIAFFTKKIKKTEFWLIES